MPIFMTNKNHGATHVNSSEVAEHEKNGWKVDTYENWIAQKNAPVIEEAPKVENLEYTEAVPDVVKAKPGRKPKVK